MSSSMSTAWLGARTGIDPGRVETMRRRGELLGVRVGDQFEFPSWQFGPDGRPLPALARVVAAARSVGMTDERLAQLLSARSGLGGDRCLGDSLRDGNVEHVLSVVLASR